MFDICLHSILEKTVHERFRVTKQSKNLSPQLLYLCAHIHSLVTLLWAGCHWLFHNIKQVIYVIRWRHVRDFFFQLISPVCPYFNLKINFLPASLHLVANKCLVFWFYDLRNSQKCYLSLSLHRGCLPGWSTKMLHCLNPYLLSVKVQVLCCDIQTQCRPNKCLYKEWQNVEQYTPSCGIGQAIRSGLKQKSE